MAEFESDNLPDQGLPLRAAGFTLLEVVVALAIAALGIGLVMQVFAGGLRNIDRADAYLRAVTIAESQLARVGSEIEIANGSKSGETDSGFAWTISMSQFAPEEFDFDETLRLYEVVVSVEWGPAVTRRSLDLHSMRLSSVD